MKKKNKGFTLIELISVLVILAILALIVTPLVLNIIRKARTSADKRSIDAYGRSIELAVADYLLDKGTFPTSIEQLTIEYSGDEVVCNTTKLNADSSVYLAECTVGGRNIDRYTYGTEEVITYEAYKVGDKVSYNNVTYYVIEDSNESNDTVKLLKENPLLKTEMDALNLTDVSIISGSDSYGGVEYGLTTDYSSSIVKKVVDAWANTAVKSDDTATARLITKDEIEENFELEEYDICDGCGIKNRRFVVTWAYGPYWTMSQYKLDSSGIYCVFANGDFDRSSINNTRYIRPLIELNKSADITRVI